MHSGPMNGTEGASGLSSPAFRIGERAVATALTPDTLRYYVRLGLLPTPHQSVGGIPSVRLRRRGARALREAGAGARTLLGGDPATGWRAVPRGSTGTSGTVELDARLVELRGLRRTLKRALEVYEQQRASHPDAACPAVEELERAARRWKGPRKGATRQAPRRTRSIR